MYKQVLIAILFIDYFKEVWFKKYKSPKNIFYVLLYYYTMLLLVKCNMTGMPVFFYNIALLLYHLRHLRAKNYLLEWTWSSTVDKKPRWCQTPKLV